MTSPQIVDPKKDGSVDTESQQLAVKLTQLDGALHALNARLTDEKIRGSRADRDIEAFAFWLYDAERRIAASERNYLGSLWRQITQLLKGHLSASKDPWADKNPTPTTTFRYFLRRSPFRIYREPTFTLEGWGFPESGAAVTGLRARVDGKIFFGTYGVEEAHVPEWHGVQPNNPSPGFKIIVDTPVGRHRLSLEAQLGGDPQWYSFLNLPIWCVGEGNKT